MLIQLEIQDVALIDKVSIELGAGLNILTGETGAGKSIIIDSINAILGSRVSKDIVRTGSEKALIEAVFLIDADKVKDVMNDMGMEPEEDGTIILSREISLSGRNTCRVNGKMVAASFLRAIGERLIDIHGQQDNQSLLKTENHIELLDSFGGEKIQSIKREYLSLLDQYKKTKAELKTLSGDPGERERKTDLLRYQVNEIKGAKLVPEEDTRLSKQKMLLVNAEKIAGSLSVCYSLLSSGEARGRSALDIMNEALSHLNTISGMEESYEELSKRLQDVIYQLEDIVGDVRKHHENVEYDPALLEEIEERLDLIYKLKRKYGPGIEDVLQYCSTAEKQLEELENSGEIETALREKLEELDMRLFEVSRLLNAERKKAAMMLEERIGRQLDDLEMKNASFKVDIRMDTTAEGTGERKYTQYGLDRVEFLISPNAGEPLKPLARIASGGEMARIMLAIKTILADVDSMPTLIFDEIDNGISGKAARKVGEKLSYISGRHQVICVTHLPQIACMADHHYLIEKFTDDNRTRTMVRKLEGNSKVTEIARLIGGTDISDTSLKYAEEMINNAKKAIRV
ncbi:MAG: DNA repair protein RecN [Acetivibrionales bacterium]|jgi:DNA repair protein RecN (Recombination protein N)